MTEIRLESFPLEALELSIFCGVEGYYNNSVLNVQVKRLPYGEIQARATNGVMVAQYKWEDKLNDYSGVEEFYINSDHIKRFLKATSKKDRKNGVSLVIRETGISIISDSGIMVTDERPFVVFPDIDAIINGFKSHKLSEIGVDIRMLQLISRWCKNTNMEPFVKLNFDNVLDPIKITLGDVHNEIMWFLMPTR